MAILLDGNNLALKLSATAKSQDPRQALLKLLLNRSRAHSKKIIVFFDGPPPEGAPEQSSYGRLSVRYTGSEPADIAILREVRKVKGVVVVTADGELARAARSQGAKVVDPISWWRVASRPAHGRRSTEQGPEKPDSLSPKELEYWMKVFGAGKSRKK